MMRLPLIWIKSKFAKSPSMKKRHLLLLSMLSGALFAFSWPVNGLPFLIFFAFVPLLFIEEFVLGEGRKSTCCALFKYTYPAFLIWNAATTWWVGYSTLFGVFMAILLNALFMSITFGLFHSTRKWLPSKNSASWALIFYWISFEFLHLDWDLSWPWLNIGNVFSSWHSWVQWYEFTGIFGGAFWILIVNILIFKILNAILQKKVQSRLFKVQLIMVFLFFLGPLILSKIMYATYEEKGSSAEIVIVQPDNDPWTEQYNLSGDQVAQQLIDLAKPLIDSSVQLIVCPESALYDDIWEHQFKYSAPIKKIRRFLQQYPGLHMVVGASTSKHYTEGLPNSKTYRLYVRANGDSVLYDNYNTALYITAEPKIELYHKSKLVPGPEKMPFHRILKPFQELAFDLGGTVGSLGSDEERTVFNASGDLRPAPIICYESIYGEFVTDYVKKGANMLLVITNDGWWSNSPGRKQHLAFSSLRCIETRRSMARSANTGISAFFNQKGDILLDAGVYKETAIRHSLSLNNEKTWYVLHGDYIANIALFLSVLLLLYNLSEYLRKKGESTKK